jgi:hypothetical protein
MILYYLKNLTSKDARRLEFTEPVPNNRPQFADKAAYRAWCNSQTTDHAFLSPVSGLTPSLRVSAGNPAATRYGIVAEFDASVPADWRERCARADIPPTWVHLTFSGNARAWWEFEHPIGIVSRKLDEAFLDIAFRELKAGRLLPGFEEAESADPAHYFEFGTQWEDTGGVVPAATVEGWLARACAKIEWKKEGTAVPLEKVREECAKRFPGRWPGGWEAFTLGARGCRFWDALGDATSVLVVESGCVCFTGDKSFVPWADILGADWVRRANDNVVGEAINGIYYDSGTSKYWSNNTACGWVSFGVDDIRRRLALRGISTSCPKGATISEADRALIAIQQVRIVDGAIPAFFRPMEIVEVNQRRYLNISRIKLFPAAEGPHAWGQGFPWLAQFYEDVFGDQLKHYIAWLAHYYQSCLRGKPERGLAMFMAGDTGCGKTFMQSAVHRVIFGAAGEATAYLNGEDAFNGQLFGCPIWTVDDAISTGDPKTHQRFSQVVKAITANDEFTMRAMYREGIRMPWIGRLIVTMNADTESLRLLPSTEISLLDKIMLLRALGKNRTTTSDEHVLSELPGFCSYLRDCPRDPEVWVGGRFGIAPYHDPELLRTAENSQDTTSALELIELWASKYFGPEGAGAKEEYWEGTPTALISEFGLYDSIKDLSSRTTPNAVYCGRYLSKLVARKEPGVEFLGRMGRSCQRTYRVSRCILDKSLPSATEPF